LNHASLHFTETGLVSLYFRLSFLRQRRHSCALFGIRKTWRRALFPREFNFHGNKHDFILTIYSPTVATRATRAKKATTRDVMVKSNEWNFCCDGSSSVTHDARNQSHPKMDRRTENEPVVRVVESRSNYPKKRRDPLLAHGKHRKRHVGMAPPATYLFTLPCAHVH
jgi:hypothetical protein